MQNPSGRVLVLVLSEVSGDDSHSKRQEGLSGTEKQAELDQTRTVISVKLKNSV